MELELTQKEKDMATTGIVFSVSKPNYLSICDGLEGGNYVCEAIWNNNEYITLVIYDMNLGSETQRISLNGREVKYLRFWYNYKGASKNRAWDSDDSFIISDKGKETLEDGANEVYCAVVDASDTWDGLSADIVAKRLFIEILTSYRRENDHEASNFDIKEEASPI